MVLENSITVFAPASVSNVACGFDVLGFAIDNVGDTITVSPNSSGDLKITWVRGPGSERVPQDPSKNTATVSARALLNATESNSGFGFDFEIEKGVLFGSGLGSSASSAVAAVFAINSILGNPFKDQQLLEFAGKGEAISSNSLHLDNVAASLMGGFILVRSQNPPDVVKLTYDKRLTAIVVHPQIEISTQHARELLPTKLELKLAAAQWANLGAFVAALQNNDVDLMRRSMNDYVAEPFRKELIPEYDQIKRIAMTNGAIGCNISGSGPAVFCLTDNMEVAETIKQEFSEFMESQGIKSNIYTSSISTAGARIVNK